MNEYKIWYTNHLLGFIMAERWEKDDYSYKFYIKNDIVGHFTTQIEITLAER